MYLQATYRGRMILPMLVLVMAQAFLGARFQLGFLLLPSLAVGLLFIFRPVVFIYLLLLFRPLMELSTQMGLLGGGGAHTTLNLNAVVAVFVIGLVSVRFIGESLVLRERSQVPPADPVDRAWFFFLAYMLAVSLAFSDHRLTSLLDFGRLANMLAVYWLAKRCGPTSPRAALGILICILISALPPLMGQVQQIIAGGGKLEFGSVTRRYGFFVNAVVYSQFMALIATVCMAYWMHLKKWRAKFLALGGLGVILLSQALSYGKGGWGGTIVGILTLSVLERGLADKLRKVIIVGCAIATAGFLVIELLPGVEDYVLRVLDVSTPEESSMATRFMIWRALVPYFLENPVFGHGLMGGYLGSQFFLGKLIEPHNDYFRLLLDGGLLGLGLYLILIVTVLKSMFRFLWRLEELNPAYGLIVRALLAMEISFLAMALVDNIITSLVLQYPIWITAGMVRRIYENSVGQHPPLPGRG